MFRPWWFNSVPAGELQPPDLANLKQWYAARLITPQTDDTDLDGWDDSSGNGYHVTQGTAANKPHYRTGASAWAINGQPVVDFGDTYAKFFSNTTQNPFTAGAARTIYVVGQDLGNSYAPGTCITYRRSGQVCALLANYSLAYVYTDGVNAPSNATIVSNETTTNNPFSWVWRLQTGSNIRCWTNFAELTVTQGAPCTTESGSTGFDIGGANGLLVGWNKTMAELLCYSGLHDASTMAQVQSYINSYYGI